MLVSSLKTVDGCGTALWIKKKEMSLFIYLFMFPLQSIVVCRFTKEEATFTTNQMNTPLVFCVGNAFLKEQQQDIN